MGVNATISNTTNAVQSGINDLPLSAAEQALKDRIDRYNQLPEVKGEELVDQYLDLQTTSTVIKSAVQMVQSDAHTNLIDQDTKQTMTAEIKTASQHLLGQASDFLTVCKEYKDQNGTKSTS